MDRAREEGELEASWAVGRRCWGGNAEGPGSSNDLDWQTEDVDHHTIPTSVEPLGRGSSELRYVHHEEWPRRWRGRR